ncbi:MAG: NifU family protein [Holophagales bacterium]|nr:NifU family protein [Holophagales bacterium]
MGAARESTPPSPEPAAPASGSAASAGEGASPAAREETGGPSHLERLARRVDEASEAVRELGSDAEAKALELGQAIEAFHKEGLTTLVRTLLDDPRGKELLMSLVEDPGVYTLFSMHGLVRADLATRVARVLDATRPYLRSHGGDVELVDIRDGKVRVRMSGACNGCSMSAVTLRQSIEEALVERIPEIRSVEEVKDRVEPSFVPLDSLRTRTSASHGWQQGPPLSELEHGRLFRLDLPTASVVLLRLGERVQAFRNACAHQGLPIDGGRVDCDDEGCGDESWDDATLTCPWHGFRFDAVSGECLTAPQAQLEPFPLRVEDGVVWVRPS